MQKLNSDAQQSVLADKIKVNAYHDYLRECSNFTQQQKYSPHGGDLIVFGRESERIERIERRAATEMKRYV